MSSSARFGLSGPRHCVVAACSSSTIAIGYAADAIRAGTIDAALAGGADVLCRLTFSGFNALRLVDTEPCRPFDAGRQGMTIGEAAAVLVLEDLDRATGARRADLRRAGRLRRRPARRTIPTSPEPDGHVIAATIRGGARRRAVCRPTPSITSTRMGPARCTTTAPRHARFIACSAIARASVPVNAIKSMTGHCLGAAGAIEAAVLALTIARGVIPPTDQPSARAIRNARSTSCPTRRASCEVRCGLSTSLAFGGNDAALVMRQVE